MTEYEDKEFLMSLEKSFNVTYDELYSKLVHFQSTTEIPFQRWYPYREGYSYKLVDKLIKHYNVKGPLLDPFVGSGSSILAGRYNNIQTYGIDVNPIALFISKVENQYYSIEDIQDIKNTLDAFKNIHRDKQLRTTNFGLAKTYFNKDILQALLQIKENISNIENKKIKDVFFLSWLSVIESVSNVKKEGNGLKHRNRKRLKTGYINIPLNEWEQQTFPADKFSFVNHKINEKLNRIITDLENNKIEAPNPVMWLGSSIDHIKDLPDPIELTVFSPPYVNFFDYFEIHKIELWLGDFISNQSDLRQLKKTGIRSNASATVSKELLHTNSSVAHLVNLIGKKKLWSKRIPDVIAGYFDDMESLLANLFLKTQHNGRVAIVIGNSAYAGIIVPSDLLIAEIGQKIGFSVEKVIVTRHLTTSSQQRKLLTDVKQFMRESIVILRKE